MKKILTTTALVGTLLAGTNYAIAQTTITGQLDIGYKALSSKSTTDANGKAVSYRGITRETQINVSNKGKLNNGLDYVAGFSLEMDGGEAINTGSTGENVYIDLIAGKTMFTIGGDHFMNPNFEITNLAGGVSDIDDVVTGQGSTTSTGTLRSLASVYSTNSAASANQAFGAALTQDFGVAKAMIAYFPDRTAGSAMSNDGSGFTAVDAGNSQIEGMIRGNLGVKGLDAFVYRGKSESDTPGTANSGNDLTGTKYGASYNFGQFSVAASQSKVTTSTDMDAKTTSLGVAFAASKDLTIGLIHSKTEADNVASDATSKADVPDEKLKAINIGYNLGPVVANLVYVDGDNNGGVSGNDPKAVHLNLTTKF